jgi:hypothetical protein
MGAGSSKPGEEGIITVNTNRSASPTSRGPSRPAAASSNSQDAAATAAASTTEALMLHLRELQAKAPSLEASAGSSSSKAAAAAAAQPAAAAAGAEPESLLNDIQIAKQISSDAGRLNASIHEILTSYQAWHHGNVKLIVTNQEYLDRKIVEAETKAAKAVRHVQLQTNRLKALSSGLADAASLPGLLADITASTAALQEQLQQLEEMAAQQQQQQDAGAGKNASAAAGSSASSGSGLFRRSVSPAPKQQQQQQVNEPEQQQQEQAIQQEPTK